MSIWIPVVVAGLGAVATIAAAAIPVAFQLFKLRAENTQQHAEGRALITEGLDRIESAVTAQGERLGAVEEVVFGSTQRIN